MKDFGVKFTIILFFISYSIVTSEAQILLPSSVDQAEKVRTHQDKLDYLQILKAKIELKQGRPGQDTLPSNGLRADLSHKGIMRKPKTTKLVSKKKKVEAPNRLE